MYKTKRFLNSTILLFLILILAPGLGFSQRKMVHPGLSHKKSDLDRMKYQVEAKLEPWYSSYMDMCELPTANYNYSVQGDTNIIKYEFKNNKFNSDSRAAYYCALRWVIEQDERYAEKAIEALMAWTGIKQVEKMSLQTAPIWLLIEAAELIKTTYSGWSATDIQKFKDMLVYPGYSTKKVPPSLAYRDLGWYWSAYHFDEWRAGNQELCGVRTVAAMGVFMDNDTIFDRAMRYVSNLPHRPDDLPYPTGPHRSVYELSRTEYEISYKAENVGTIEDYGFDGVLPYNIYANGQNVESYRDQGHTTFSLGLLCTIGEIGWNQGYDFYGLLDSRLLKGLEYTTRYCVSSVQSYPDQTIPWEPTNIVAVDELPEPGDAAAAADFLVVIDRTGRTKSLAISPDSRKGFPTTYTWELPIAHYVGRGLKTEEQVKWTTRARDYSRNVNKKYEPASTGQDYTGYGALSYHRPDGCLGDPIKGFVNDTLPEFKMNVVPCVIEAENYDYYPINAEGKTYHDTDTFNTGSLYRLEQGVDIASCSEGGYQLTALADGEWLTYTIAVPTATYYTIDIRYTAANANGKIQFSLAGEDLTQEVDVPFGEGFSTGSDDWADYTVASKVLLKKGVQSLEVYFSGESNSFEINSFSFTIDSTSVHIEAESYTEMEGIKTEVTSDDGGGENVGSIDLGDWMEYRIDVPTSKNYFIDYRVASKTEGGEFIVTSNGVSIDTIKFAATGDWQNWETVRSSESFPLTAGEQTIRILSKLSGCNINWFDLIVDPDKCDVTNLIPYANKFNAGGIESGIEQTNKVSVIPGFEVVLQPQPEKGGSWLWNGPDGFTSSSREVVLSDIQFNQSGNYIVGYTNDCGTQSIDTFLVKVIDSFLIEAESFANMSGIEKEATSDAGGGENVSSIDKDDWMEYVVEIPFTARYFIDYRVASESSSGELELLSNGELIEQISFIKTNGAQLWSTKRSSITLSKGKQTLRIQANKAGWNINWIKLTVDQIISPCTLPFIYDELQISGQNQNWSSGAIDISCAPSVNVFMDIEGTGMTDETDYLNVYYKIDGGELIPISEKTGSVDLISETLTNISGNTIEIIINGNCSGDEFYTVSNIRIAAPPEFLRIEAEDFFSMDGIDTENCSEGTLNVGWVHDGDWCRYNAIDLTGAQSITVRASSGTSGGEIEVRIGSETGTLLGTIPINGTGGWQSWRNAMANLDDVEGIHDVYLVLKGGSGYLFNLNWLQFSTKHLIIDNISTMPKKAESTIYYPNPVNTYLNVKLAQQDFIKYAVYNITGTKIFEKEIESGTELLQINFEGFQSGAYFLVLNGNQVRETLKVIKR